MKKKIFFCVIIFYSITTLSFIATNQIPGTTPDTIRFVDFDMCATGVSYTPFNTALLDESSFLSKFGTPIISSSEYSNEDEANMNHFVYNGAEAWYMNDNLQALIFTSSNYKFVMSNGIIIKVGDAISTTSALFPNSWVEMDSPNQVFVQLMNSSGPVDMTVLFQFDPATGLITSISLQ